jgi:hypothetical protein
VPPSRLASTESFGCGVLCPIRRGAPSTTTSTVLRTIKGNVPFFTLERMGLWAVRDVRLDILPATPAGSSPALPVACSTFDRHDGREDHGRVVRTSGRRGLCRRDHARRGSPAHIRVQLRARSGSAASSTPASVSWSPEMSYTLVGYTCPFVYYYSSFYAFTCRITTYNRY